MTMKVWYGSKEASDMIRPEIHPDITHDRVCEAIEDSEGDVVGSGFCINCGFESLPIELDAERYECKICGKKTIYGLLYLAAWV